MLAENSIDENNPDLQWGDVQNVLQAAACRNTLKDQEKRKSHEAAVLSQSLKCRAMLLLLLQ